MSFLVGVLRCWQDVWQRAAKHHQCDLMTNLDRCASMIPYGMAWCSQMFSPNGSKRLFNYILADLASPIIGQAAKKRHFLSWDILLKICWSLEAYYFSFSMVTIRCFIFFPNHLSLRLYKTRPDCPHGCRSILLSGRPTKQTPLQTSHVCRAPPFLAWVCEHASAPNQKEIKRINSHHLGRLGCFFRTNLYQKKTSKESTKNFKHETNRRKIARKQEILLLYPSLPISCPGMAGAGRSPYNKHLI